MYVYCHFCIFITLTICVTDSVYHNYTDSVGYYFNSLVKYGHCVELKTTSSSDLHLKQCSVYSCLECAVLHVQS